MTPRQAHILYCTLSRTMLLRFQRNVTAGTASSSMIDIRNTLRLIVETSRVCRASIIHS